MDATTYGADVLAFGAHPDDVEICAGGLLLRMKDAGYRCVVVDFTRGERASRGDLPTRAKETEAASRLLGLAARENLGLPDGGLEDGATMAVPVIAAIRRHRPRLVVAPALVDLHPDHEAAGALVRRAYYLATIGKVEAEGLAPHRPDAIVHYFGHKEPTPSFVVDVSAVWARKMEVVRCYASQFGLDGKPGPLTNISAKGFDRRLETRFAYWGARIGATYGEPFAVERILAIDDPVEALRKRDEAVR
jgi:bacillithiol biosynthesis deacetylase BshB1